MNAQTAAPAPRRATLPVATAATLPRAPRVAAAILPKHSKLLKMEWKINPMVETFDI